jgi:hypothetical protein
MGFLPQFAHAGAIQGPLSGIVTLGWCLLTHLGQDSAVPDGYGDPSQGRRGGEQETGAPEIALLRRLIYRHRTLPEGLNLRWGMGRVRKIKKNTPKRNLFSGTASMVCKGVFSIPKIQESGFENLKICFLTKFGGYNWKFPVGIW